MKAADLDRAQKIVSGLQQIAQQRGALANGKPQQGVITLHGGHHVYLPLADLPALAQRQLDRREAELRRSAAQIGLVLA